MKINYKKLMIVGFILLLIQFSCSLKGQIQTYDQVYYELVSKKVPWPDLWVKISIAESGANPYTGEYTSYYAKHQNNIFAFICKGHYYDDCYETYANKDSAVVELIRWINLKPPMASETPQQYLLRRRYNTVNPRYYQYVASIVYPVGPVERNIYTNHRELWGSMKSAKYLILN